MLIAISTSGSSSNVLECIEVAKKMEVVIISMTGTQKSPNIKKSDICLSCPGSKTANIKSAI